MKKFFGILRYIKGYWNYGILNIVCNIFSVIFGLFSLTLVAPFLTFLFQSDTSRIDEIINKGKPLVKISADSVINQFNYYLAVFIKEDGKLKALIFLCVMFIIMIFFKNLFRYLAMYFVAPIRNGVVRDMRNKMMDRIMNLHLGYFSEERKGDIMSRMTTDVMEIEWSVMQSLEMIFREPLTIILYLTFLINLSPSLTLYAFALLPIAALIIVLIGKSLKRTSHKSKTVLGTLFSIMEESLGGLKVIKAFTSESFVGKKFQAVNHQFFKLSNRVYRKNDLASPLSEVMVTGIMMMILYLGGKMVIEQPDKLDGSLFITYLAIFSQLVPPVKQLTTSYVNVQRGLASAERIDKILEAEIQIKEPLAPVKLSGFNSEIEYKDLSFAYTKGDEGYVLKKINLKIAKGKTIALVGQSGSGKTTMADMVPRFYDATDGAVLIDGIDIRNVLTSDLRSLLGIVSQEPILFNDTIFNNIAFGNEHVSKEKVMEAAKIANAHEFIEQLVEGYHSNIGDRGSKLSGGQRQRISIARAVLKNPPILILDEATSALDTESERLVQDALTKLMQNRTTLVIAHRLSTIVHADEIVVLNQGEIIERGTHKALLEKNGAYKRLFDMQSFA
ncbi:MAG: ABC transporter ATP-binding protein [Bacteroidia bacterium]|nr:ABC transporter ATP-binding protein [Bacteroidia bacterium]